MEYHYTYNSNGRKYRQVYKYLQLSTHGLHQLQHSPKPTLQTTDPPTTKPPPPAKEY